MTREEALKVYTQYRATMNILDQNEKISVDILNSYPRGAMGLTLDSAKDDQWRTHKAMTGAIHNQRRSLASYVSKKIGNKYMREFARLSRQI